MTHGTICSYAVVHRDPACRDRADKHREKEESGWLLAREILTYFFLLTSEIPIPSIDTQQQRAKKQRNLSRVRVLSHGLNYTSHQKHQRPNKQSLGDFKEKIEKFMRLELLYVISKLQARGTIRFLIFEISSNL